MPDDRIAILELRLAAVERAVAELKANGGPAEPTARKDPLEGHPLLLKKMAPEEAAAHKARIDKALGIEGIELMEPAKLRQMMIGEEGLDPNGTEFSRGIMEMRDE